MDCFVLNSNCIKKVEKAEIIREYDLTAFAFDTWLRRSKTTGSFAVKDNRMPEQEAPLKLRKQNAQLVIGNDILKQDRAKQKWMSL